MLKVFRDKMKYLSWVLWIVIAVFVLFVFADFGSIQLGGTAPSDAAASVGDLEVTYAEFERSYRQIEDSYRESLGDQFDRELAQRMGLPLQVLDQLISEKILLAEAERMGLTVTDAEVVEYISSIPAFQFSDGGFVGEERYSQILRSNGYTIDQFEAGVRSDLLGLKVRDVLSDNLFVSDEEVVEDYKSQVETASIRYLRLPAAELRDQVTISDVDTEAYFAAHPEEFLIPERRTVDYLLVDPEAMRPAVAVGDEEIRAYYDENSEDFAQDEQVRARHILLRVDADRTEEQAQEQMAEIRQRLAAGEDFAALALELSDDPGSKTHGGDLGLFGRGQMIGEFEEAAFNAQPGEIVGPVRTSFGFHLIEVLEKLPAGQRPFDQAAEEIRQQLVTERSRAAAEAKAQELAVRLQGDDDASFEDFEAIAAAEVGVTAVSTDPFAVDDNVPDLDRMTTFSTTAFELGEGEISAAVSVARGWVVMKLTGIEEPRTPTLDEVRDEVESAVADERQLEMAQARLAAAKAEIEAGKAMEEVATDLGLSVTESTEFRRQGSITGLGNSPEVAAAALALDTGQLGDPIVHNRDVVLFEVTQRQRYDPLRFEQEKEGAADRLRQERLGQILSSIIAQRREEMGVRYSPQLIESFELAVGQG